MLGFLAKQLNWIDKIVGYVWFFLIVIMATLTWLAGNQQGIQSYAFLVMIGLIISVFAYGLYTNGFRWAFVGFSGNIFTIGLTIIAIQMLKQADIRGANLLFLQIVWLSIATLCLGSQLLLDTRKS